MTHKTLVVATLAALALGACASTEDAKPPAAAPAKAAAASPASQAAPAAEPASVHTVSVAQLAGWRSDDDVKVAVFDANSADTRKNVGTIPGAVMLESYRDCAGELPSDKDEKLVFYCYNEMCGASHAAARVASSAGYRDVSGLTAGIMGWKDAGQPVDRL